MSTLKINLNSAGVSIGMFAVPSENPQVSLDFTGYKSHVLVTGLDNWDLWQQEFLAVVPDESKTLITFEVV